MVKKIWTYVNVNYAVNTTGSRRRKQVLQKLATSRVLSLEPKSYVVFLSIVWVVWLNHSRCTKWRPFAFTHACSRVCHWSVASSMMPSGIRSQVSMSPAHTGDSDFVADLSPVSVTVDWSPVYIGLDTTVSRGHGSGVPTGIRGLEPTIGQSIFSSS